MDHSEFIHSTPFSSQGYPQVTPEFARALEAHFGGGHTPALRDAFAALLRAAEEAQR